MFSWIFERARFVRRFVGILYHSVFARLWALLGAADLSLSQIIPPKYSEKIPKLSEVAAMTFGLESWQFWVVSGSLVVAVVAFETAFRALAESEKTKPSGDAKLSALDTAFLEDRKALSDAVAALRDGVMQIRHRPKSDAPSALISAREDVRKLAGRLSFDEKLDQDCREAVHLGDIIIDSIRNYEDCREDLGKFDQLTRDIQKRALSIVQQPD